MKKQIPTTTTSDLIALLKSIEFGASGRAREIALELPDGQYLSTPQFSISSTGDGIAGAEVTILID